MYIIPGYVCTTEKADGIWVTSKLLRNTVQLTDLDIQEEFRDILRDGGCETLDTPLKKFLHEQEMLLLHSEVDAALEQLRERLNEILRVTIMPTEGCNFRCPYCYEDHKAVTMRHEVLNTIQEYVLSQIPNFEKIQLDWFGGEPTLCQDMMLKTSLAIQAACNAQGKAYSASITTNGYLLDADLFRQLYDAGIISYQITLDGWDHDKTRPHVTGKGTLQQIIKNLLQISQLPKEDSFRIILRHNILPGDEDYSWYDYLARLFGDDHRFSVFVHPVGDWGGTSVKSLNILSSESAADLVRKHREYLQKLHMEYQPDPNAVFSEVCYAGYPHGLVFRPDGSIVKCTVVLDSVQNRVGYVSPDTGISLDSECNQQWCGAPLTEDCYTCSNLLTCMNLRCPKLRVLSGKPFVCKTPSVRRLEIS